MITDEVCRAAVVHIDFRRKVGTRRRDHRHVQAEAGGGEGFGREAGSRSTVGIFADRAIPRSAHIHHAAGRKRMRNVKNRSERRAMIIDVALGDGRGQTGTVAVLLAPKEDEHAVGTSLVGKVVVDPDHGLVVRIPTGIRSDVVVAVDVACNVGFWQKPKKRQSNGADAVCRYRVVGKLVASVLLARTLTSNSATRGAGVVNVVAAGGSEVVGQVDAAIGAREHVRGSNTRNDANRQHFAPSFKGEEEVRMLFPGVAADRPAELVLVVGRFRRILLVQLKGVRVEDGIAPEFVDRSVKSIAATFHHGIHRATRFATILRVIGVGHHLELFNGVDRRSDVPRARTATTLR